MVDRCLDSRYPSPQTVELCSSRARSSVPKVIYNGAAKHVFSWTRFREPFSAKPEKLRCQKKHRNFEAGFGVNTGASRRIARHTRAHWRAHESSDPSRASHRRIVVRKRPLDVRNSHVPFGKTSRISPERRRESSLVSGKKTREVHGRGEAVIPARAR